MPETASRSTRPSVLMVFLASPSDVHEERRAAYDIICRLNESVAPNHGFLIHLARWEGLSPAYGRPQEIINRYVDECDVFVAVLHERWGSPTGQFTSGFEEEFQRALQRRRSTGRPDIKLFFRTPSAASLEKPSPQLAQVLSFRKSVQDSNELLFGEFAGGDSWKERFTDAILNVLAAPSVVISTAETVAREAEALGVRATFEELKERLVAAMNSLPEREKFIITLYYYERLTLGQIAEVLHVSPSTVARQRDNAITRLASLAPEVKQYLLNPLAAWLS